MTSGRSWRLSVFRSPFDMEAAVAVVADGTISRANVIDGIADLTAKSLVAADVSGPTTCFYLLETTRSYAAEKLIEPAPVTQRLLEEYKGRLERAIQFLSRMSKPNLRQTMKLNAALGVAILNTNGSISQMGEAFRKALDRRGCWRPVLSDEGALGFVRRAEHGRRLCCHGSSPITASRAAKAMSAVALVQASPVLATFPSMNEIARAGRQRGLALDNCTIIEVT
jgi:hypothetical protein